MISYHDMILLIDTVQCRPIPVPLLFPYFYCCKVLTWVTKPLQGKHKMSLYSTVLFCTYEGYGVTYCTCPVPSCTSKIRPDGQRFPCNRWKIIHSISSRAAEPPPSDGTVRRPSGCTDSNKHQQSRAEPDINQSGVRIGNRFYHQPHLWQDGSSAPAMHRG